jgi:SAM-dependent methyltransferase
VSADDVDVAALFARLKEEVRGLGRAGSANGLGQAQRLKRVRDQAERSWSVSAERPLQGNPASRRVKWFLRKLMRWYVEPLAVEQRTFNDAALKLVDGVSERADVLAARVDEAERALAQRALDAKAVTELEERLTRLERRERSGGGPATVAPQPNAAALPDYFAFESKMRASTEEIRERQRPYVEDFREAAPVLDLGCGRGEFLALLRDAGIEARGVDADADMAAYARGEGLAVEQADVVAYLESVADASLGGVFAAQLVEHLPPPALVRTLELCARKLRPGGVLVAETINPLSPIALRHYFADLTHAQPLVPETLALLAKQSGFGEVELRYLNPPDERLREVSLPEGAEFDAARDALASNVRRLNETVFAPLDYAIVARA